MCSVTLLVVLGWVCIGISLCIGQLGRKIVYVFFRLVLKSCVMILIYLEDVTKSL